MSMRNPDVAEKSSVPGANLFLRGVVLLLCVVRAASPAPLHWQLNNVTLSDGGRAFGGFDYDASSATYSNINITTTAGSVLQSSYYNSVAPYANPTPSTTFNGVSTVPVFSGTTLGLSLSFASPLTGAGGTISFAGAAAESVCASATCNTFTPMRTVSGGTISAISSSAPKRWYISGVVLSDGAQVFGSFVYDINSNTYSSISVTTTAGTVVQSATYNVVSPTSGPKGTLNIVSAPVVVPSNTTTLSMTFNNFLGNSGGTVNISSVTEATCTSVDCSSGNTLRTAAVNGTVSSVPPRGYTAILPQIADGGGFITQILLTNPTGNAITCRLTFWKDDGAPLFLSLSGGGPLPTYVVKVPGHGTQFLTTPGLGSSVTGWALAENVAQLGVIAAFRKVDGNPVSEATVAATPATAGFGMAFDESPGFDTGFALANVSPFDTAIENLYFYDTSGKLILADSSNSLGPHQHESFMFSARYPQLAGKRGTVRLYYGVEGTPTNGTLGLTGLGLRVNPAGTFTSLATTTIDEAQ